MYKTNMENEKNNVTSRYAETYTTACKLRNVAPHRNKWSRRRPDGARDTSGRFLTAPDGSGRLLVGPKAIVYIRLRARSPVESLSIHPVGVAFTSPIMGKRDVIHKPEVDNVL